MCTSCDQSSARAIGQAGVRFGWKAKSPETNLIPPRHKPWGTWEFCNAMEAIFGGQESKFEFEKYEDVKTKLDAVEFMDEAKGHVECDEASIDARSCVDCTISCRRVCNKV